MKKYKVSYGTSEAAESEKGKAASAKTQTGSVEISAKDMTEAVSKAVQYGYVMSLPNFDITAVQLLD